MFLLGFVQGQGQNSEQKHETKKLVEFHVTSLHLLTMNQLIYEATDVAKIAIEIVFITARIIALLDFISAVQYVIHFIYHFIVDSLLTGKLEPTNDQLLTSVSS